MASHRHAAIAAAAALWLGCETPLGQQDGPTDFLRGDWSACLNDGATDYHRELHFYSDSYSGLTRTFPSTDRSCTGAATGTTTEIWRYRLGGTVTARVGPAGAEVLARELNAENSYVTVYTIVYVDEHATPQRLYLGDLALDPLQDGTAPERRPGLLSTTTALSAP